MREYRVDRGWLRYGVLFLGLFLFMAGAVAAERTYEFQIPRTDAGTGLKMFARQSDTPLLFLNKRVRDRKTNRLSGRYTVREALDILLRNTGIRGAINHNGVLTVTVDNAVTDDAGGKMKKKHGFFAKLASVLIATAAALQAAPASAQDNNSKGTIEEVVVTAQKRAQNIQDVPITMEAFSGSQLRDQQVKKVDDIIKLAPGLSLNFNNMSNSGISIRGVGTDNFHGNVNRAVGIYYDEAFMATPYSGTLGVFDLERVEILRGPQNTLFGRNTTGGAIRYITKKPVPGEPVSGYVSGTYGRFNEHDLEGAVSVPLGHDAAARIALQTVNNDGAFTNLAPGRVGEKLGTVERHSGRVEVAWNVSDDTSVLASFQFGINRGDNLGEKARGMRDPADPTQFCPELATSADFRHANSCVDINGDNPSTNSWNTLYNVAPRKADIDVYGGTFTVKHDFTPGQLSSVTTFYRTRVKLDRDVGGMIKFQFDPMQDSVFNDFSQELRFQSPDNQALRWLVGAYYFHESMVQGTIVRRDANGAAFPGGEVTPFNILDQKDQDISVYGQVDYDLTNKLTLTGGLRYTNNQKSADSLFGVAPSPTATIPPIKFLDRGFVKQATAGAPLTCPPPPVPCRVPPLKPKQDINKLGARAGFNYHLYDNLMVYANYSRGFKSGGFDTRALAAFFGNPGVPVKPEILNAFEAGFKSDLLGNTLRVDAAAFYYLWEDQQVFATIKSIPGFFNIPESVSRGVEASIRWSPRRDWRLQLSGSFDDTNISDAGGLEGIDQGIPLRNAPKFSFTGLLSKDFDIFGGLLNFRSDFRYVGKQYDTLERDDRFLTTRKSQFYVNVRAAYNFGPERQYQISAYGENLTSDKACYERDIQDNPTVITASPVASTVPCTPNIGKPVYGITATVHF